MTRLSLGNYALIGAGLLAVMFASPAAHAIGGTTGNGSGAAGGGQELQYVTTTTLNVPGFLKMMMGHKGEQPPTTTTISTYRTRRDDGKGTSTIVECDLSRIITIDDNAKTYTVLSFDDEMKTVAAALAKAQAAAKAATPAPASTTMTGTGRTAITLDEKPDNQTQVIAGLTAHHAVDTITISEQGTGDCPSFSQSMTEDVWFAPPPVKMSCPTKLAIPTIPSAPGQSSNPCAQNMMIQANSVRSAQPRIMLKSTMSMPGSQKAGMNISTTTLVTSLKTQPYEPAFFDIPAGYTKVDASTASPPPHR
ncbi:MAG TPA: hypothetical protein VII69_03965 [Candidatus Eremiobacteraceae bacterium]